MKHNTPSLALADALHIPVEKAGTEKKAMNLIKALIKSPAVRGAVGNAAFWDYQGQDAQPWENKYWEDTSRHRVGMGLINALLGAGGGHAIGKGVEGLAKGVPGAGEALASGAATVALSPVKDLIIGLLPSVSKVGPALEQVSNPSNISNFLSNLTPMQKLLAAVGVLGVGGLAYKGVGALSDLAKAQKQRAAGKVQVTLPTKAPGDTETMLELPVGDESISSGQLEKLQRDVRRRLRKETNERTYRRGAKPLLELEDAEPKAASLHKIQSLINLIHG